MTSSHRHVHPSPPAHLAVDGDLSRWDDDGGSPPPASRRTANLDAHWLRISAALTARLPELAGRDDVIVTCEDGTRSGAPAAFYPTLAALEIDTSVFKPLHPARIRPEQVGEEDCYPVAWGALVHEAAHAAHSRWTTPRPLLGTELDEAAQLLEESRAERAHLARRPTDRRYLRATVRTLILDDLTADTPTTVWHTAQAAALILARRDAGILDPDETQPLAQLAEQILGSDLLTELTRIWQAVHATADADADTMLDHARAWCDALNNAPTAPPPTGDPGGSAAGRGALARAVDQVTGAVAANQRAQAAAEHAVRAASAARAAARTEQAGRQRAATATAKAVFAPGARPHLPASAAGGGFRARSPITGSRPPTSAEQRAAATLARALRQAAYRARTDSVTTSAAPPGRLNMRAALARDAQRAAGATPTAQPWVSTQRRHTPNPPLRVGIAVDVSGSMSAATAPIASATWILAKATALTDPASRAATVAYDLGLTAVTAPGRTPAHVTEFRATGAGHSLAEAIDALTAGLDLTRPGAARLLVIVSDARYFPDETDRAAQRMKHLGAAGCALLWITFHQHTTPPAGATLLELADPARAVTAIARAVTTTMAAAR
ncbi:vWA domain-containing protein [Streptacidiphilus rugosus]|uniref:VWA domain-containing protein n=1 Tax=Streptacidiphilus rugosus TaxID=405783 RepID=UPI000567CD42|nr:VWA domain-containing protein [Streptacidiphilus rugosus]